jgi:hypothetical protein
MDLSPGTIFSGLLLGAIGTALFIYGKKQTDFRCLFAGIALCVAPYLIGSLLVLWLASAAVLAGLIAWIKYSG